MKVVDEYQIRQAHKRGDCEIDVSDDVIITPAARDLAASLGLVLRDHKKQIYGKLLNGACDLKSNANTIIALGCDHGGYELKEALKPYLKSLGYKVLDHGCFSDSAVDYPDYARLVAESIYKGAATWGLMIDGAGIGSCMVANKVPGVRAAMCYDEQSAANSREHNNANVLTLGGKVLDLALAKRIIKCWLETPFGGGRHQRRIDKIDAVETLYSKVK